MLRYKNQIQTADGLTLSVDMITVDYFVRNPRDREVLPIMLDTLPIKYTIEVRMWESFKMGSFRGNYAVKFADGNSFYIGVALNAAKTVWDHCRLEYNPNKVANQQVFWLLLDWFNSHTLPIHRRIKRFDLAIDIPVDRADVHLVKDRRVYSMRRDGKALTEYLGAKSSTPGRAKLYNKANEANLNYPLTRLELTLDPQTSFAELPMPQVYYFDTHQMQLDEVSALNDTNRFILKALMEGFGSLHELGRRTRETLKQYLDSYCQWVKISESDYKKILAQLDMYLGLSPLEIRDVISDKVPASASANRELPY